jgi:hypothetical protein
MVYSVDEMEEDYIILDANNIETFEAAQKRFKDGWVKSDISYNPFGTETMRLLHIIKYTDEEKAEIEAIKKKRIISPRPPIDENCLTVPILKYEEEKAGAENAYKILASKGFREVHRTSTVAVMKLSDPRGVIMSDEDLELILKLIDAYHEDKVGTTEHTELKIRIDALHYRLFTIYEESQASRRFPEPQEPTEPIQ